METPVVTDVTQKERSSTLALDLRGVTKDFPGVRALDNVDLAVPFGEIHGVLGENGAGKSTLVSVATGALAADQGEVFVAGHQLLEPAPNIAKSFGIAIVRQEPALLPDLTVAENLYLGVSPSQRPRLGDLKAWARQTLRLWGEPLSFDVGVRVEQLNAQQRFIVDFCRAIVQDPRVLVLDEPTEHLLRDEVETLFGLTKAHAAKGNAVVYISHRISEVQQLADRITILRNGRSEGTYEMEDLTQERIIELIVGRQLDAYFPPKGITQSSSSSILLKNFTAPGVSPISTELKGGRIIGLAGMEGNGQSDFLRALAGLERSHGGLTLDGQQMRHHNLRSARTHHVAFLSGERHREGVLTTLSVGENLSYRSLRRLATGGLVSGMRERTLVSDLISTFRVKTPSADTPIESLSGGNQQKALLAGLLATNPRVILVEEPTQGVDVGARSEIYGLLREAAERGTVVVVLSSDAAEVAGICDEVLVFSRGHVVERLIGDAVQERAITGAALVAGTERVRSETAKRPLTQWLAGDWAPLAIALFLVALVALLGWVGNPLFLSPFNVQGILALTAVLGFVAVGQLFALLTAGIDISVGPLTGFTVVLLSFYLIDGATTVNQVSGWLLVALAAIAVGVSNWALIEYARLSPIAATLISYMAIQGLSAMLRPTPGGVISRPIIEGIRGTLGPLPMAFIILLVAAILLDVMLRRTGFGISLRAVGSNDLVARVNGVRPRSVKLVAYVACSLSAAAAGVLLVGQYGIGDSKIGVALTLASITAAVVGGASVFGARGSFVGAVAGALLTQVVQALMVFRQFSPDIQYYVAGLMTIAAVAVYSVARKRIRISG